MIIQGRIQGVGTWGHVPSPPWRRRRPPIPVYFPTPDREAIFRLFRPKKVTTKFDRRCSQKRSTKIALVTGGTLSTVRPLGNNERPLGVVPLDAFLKYATVIIHLMNEA